MPARIRYFADNRLIPLAVALETLELDPDNELDHTEASVQKVVKLLIRFGWRDPVHALKSRKRVKIVIRGNRTLMAARWLAEAAASEDPELRARAMGHESWWAGADPPDWLMVPALFFADDAATRVAWRISHNKSAEAPAWDWGILAENMAEVSDEVDWGELGWSAEELAELFEEDEPEPEEPGAAPPEPEEPPIPEVPAEPVTKRGEVIQLGPHVLHCEDCMVVMAAMPDNSVDFIGTDGPYGLSPDGKARTWDEIEVLRAEGKGPKSGFMGKAWDAGVPGLKWARECLRILKPGGHLVSYSATRTYHRHACAVEDAGFEIRDMFGWQYYCLTDDAQILTSRGWVGIDDAIGDALALCYSIDDGGFEWGEVEDRFAFEHDADLYRVSGDHGSHRITDGHRLVVERGATRGFETARDAARKRETSIPLVEDLRGLLGALPDPHEGAGDAEQGLLSRVLVDADQSCSCRADDSDGGSPRDGRGHVCRVRGAALDSSGMGETQCRDLLLTSMHGQGSGPGVGEASEARGRMDGRAAGEGAGPVHGPPQSSVERRRDLPKFEGELQGPALRPMPARPRADGEEGRLRDGASPRGRAGARSAPVEDRGRAPHEPRPAGQQGDEPGSVLLELGPQALRVAGHTRADLVRFERERYAGRVWCVKVPTGAFVARVGDGIPFVTGNSGFPKSLNVSKAIDKMHGAEREVIGPSRFESRRPRPGAGATIHMPAAAPETAPATEDAKTWAGWGTALKPAFEPAVVARKPLSEPTVALNVLKWGTGAINIDAGRFADGDPAWPGPDGALSTGTGVVSPPSTALSGGVDGSLNVSMSVPHDLGRWPANIYATPKPATSEKDAGCEDVDRKHETVKPRKLFEQLLALFCPPGGTAFEPFGGSGTTLVAACGLDCKVIACEMDPGYSDIIRARVEWALKPDAGSPPRKPGKRRKAPEDGNKRQARRRVQTLIQSGELKRPADVTCVDCEAAPGREYDHHLGYGAAHHEDVEALCASCHHKREAARENEKAPA